MCKTWLWHKYMLNRNPYKALVEGEMLVRHVVANTLVLVPAHKHTNMHVAVYVCVCECFLCLIRSKFCFFFASFAVCPPACLRRSSSTTLPLLQHQLTNDNQIKDQGNSVAVWDAATRCSAAMERMFLVSPLGSVPENNLQICIR